MAGIERLRRPVDLDLTSERRPLEERGRETCRRWHPSRTHSWAATDLGGPGYPWEFRPAPWTAGGAVTIRGRPLLKLTDVSDLEPKAIDDTTKNWRDSAGTAASTARRM